MLQGGSITVVIGETCQGHDELQLFCVGDASNMLFVLVSEEGAVWDECKNWGITKNGMSGYTVLQ
jgi:hypothetical protein